MVVAQEQNTQQEELLTELEQLLAISDDELLQRQRVRASSERDTGKSKGEHQVRKARGRRKDDAEDDSLVTRIKELESTCKQKVCMEGRVRGKHARQWSDIDRHAPHSRSCVGPGNLLAEGCRGATRDGVRGEVEDRDSQVRTGQDYQHGVAGNDMTRIMPFPSAAN